MADASGTTPATLSDTIPFAAAIGDVVVVMCAGDTSGSGGSITVTPPAGWTQVAQVATNTTDPRGVLTAFYRIVQSGDAGTTASFTFGAGYLWASGVRATRLTAITGPQYGLVSMTDTRGTASPTATWQPANVPNPTTRATYLLAEYHYGLNASSPVVTANGWTTKSIFLTNAAVIVTQVSVNPVVTSPVFVASTNRRAALGLAFRVRPLSGLDWGVDRISW